MSAEKIPAYVSLDAYNASEMEADTRSEYYNGVIVAMSGGSRSHIEMTRNISSEAAFQLRNSSCRWYTSDLCVYSPDCNSIFYPDMTVTCETPQFANTRLATLLNPTLIVEILSASTEGRDRGEKFACYRTIPSFSTYVLLAQDRPHAEVYTRQAEGSWRLEEFSEINTILKLPAVGCELRFTDIYANVIFLPRLEPRRPEDEL